MQAPKQTPEERLTAIEQQQHLLLEQIIRVRHLVGQFRRKQLKAGALGPLNDALVHHHQMIRGWASLVLHATPADFTTLHEEFSRMYQVIAHYECTIQHLLAINPSPGADLETEEEEGEQESHD